MVGIVDGKNPSMSNFMRYINCACYESQQNMVAYQYDGQIYYRSVKDIAVGEELLVWYGHEYGKELGLLNTSMTMSLGEWWDGLEEGYSALMSSPTVLYVTCMSHTPYVHMYVLTHVHFLSCADSCCGVGSTTARVSSM